MEACRVAVLAQQEERAKAYVDFETSYVAYLDGGSDSEYQTQCEGVTKRFAAASAAIRETEQALAEMSKLDDKSTAGGLGGWVRKLQEAEKSKLELTIALQVERKRARQMKEQRKERAELMDAQASPLGGGAELVQEEEEFVEEVQEGKLKWINDQVGEVVASINEALDEIRYWETE